MDNVDFYLPLIGAGSFGAFVGWVAHHVFHKAESVDVKWLASLIGVVGGGAVTRLFDNGGVLFGAYSIGLVGAFFLRVAMLPFSVLVNDELKKDSNRQIARNQRRNQMGQKPDDDP